MQAIKEKLYDCDTQKQKEKEMAKVRTEVAHEVRLAKEAEGAKHGSSPRDDDPASMPL